MLDMINNEDINKEVDKTLQSLDGLNKATANPFLFTRIKSRMQRQNGWEKATSLLNRPLIAFAVLIAVIAINTWAVLVSDEQQQINKDKGGVAILEIADEYNLVANNNYYFENIPNE